MSIINNSRSLFKSINILNCETSKSSSIVKNTMNTYLNIDKTKNPKKYETLDQPINAIDYFSMSSDTSEMYYSDSEGSKLLVLPQQNKCVQLSSLSSPPSSSDSETDAFKCPLATSSPLDKFNKIKHKYYSKITSKKVSIKRKIFNYVIKSESSKVKKCFKNSDKTISTYAVCSIDTPNVLNKTASLESNNLLIYENQEKKQDNTNLKHVSQTNINDGTDILNTNQSQITLQKPNFTINMMLNNESKNSKLTVNSNLAIDENFLNNTDLSDIFQMELSLKMFSGNIVPYLNSLKHDILQIMNKCMYKPDEQIIIRSKHVNNIFKNIHNIMKLNENNCIDSLSKKNIYTTIPFVAIGLNNLNLLNNQLECVNKKLEPIKFTLFNNIMNNQEEKSTDSLYVQNDLLECKTSDNLKSFKQITDNNNDVSSSTKTAALDSFSCVRELDKSNSLLFPISNCIDINESSKEQILEHRSLMCENELLTNEISKTVAQDISYSSYNEPHIDKLAPTNSLSSNFQVVNYNDNSVEKNQSRYWLRNHPKSTEHFIAPFKTILSKKKSCHIKSYYKDMFICKGTGNKKVILQYKISSVFKANSDELIKKICPEIKNKKFNNNNQNTTVLDISNLKQKKIEKPCLCGIFPSQVPSSWNDTLHKSLHQNLHKLQFMSQMPENVLNKINDNGFLFNIIKVPENCDDSNLRLTLKNIQDFINLEINFSKKSIDNVNHSIYLAVNPNLKTIGYLEIEPLTNACIYQNNQLSKNLIAVKFGISKLWVMVKYRNNGVATKLLKQFSNEESLNTNDIAFAFHGKHGISFIKKYFANNSVLIY